MAWQPYPLCPQRRTSIIRQPTTKISRYAGKQAALRFLRVLLIWSLSIAEAPRYTACRLCEPGIRKVSVTLCEAYVTGSKETATFCWENVLIKMAEDLYIEVLTYLIKMHSLFLEMCHYYYHRVPYKKQKKQVAGWHFLLFS